MGLAIIGAKPPLILKHLGKPQYSFKLELTFLQLNRDGISSAFLLPGAESPLHAAPSCLPPGLFLMQAFLPSPKVLQSVALPLLGLDTTEFLLVLVNQLPVVSKIKAVG